MSHKLSNLSEILIIDGNQRSRGYYTDCLRLSSVAQTIQGDQLNIAVLFWYLGKSDSSSVRYYTVSYTGQITFLQGTKKTRPCLTGHPVV